MRRHRLMLLSAMAVIIVCAMTLEASANGVGGAGGGSCSVLRPGRGAIAIRAVAAITIPDAYLLAEVPPTLFSPATVDVTLRVRKGSGDDDASAVFQAFRLELKNVPITDFLSNEALTCLFLDPGAAPVDQPEIATA